MLDNNKKMLTLHMHQNEFLSAIEYTSAKTGFRPELVEKDYYCSIVLQYLFQQDYHSLVFKGGTLLAKAHAGFYRLSEDLDFTLPTSPASTRKERSNKIKPIKEMINHIGNAIPIFSLETPLTGSNNSVQYNGVLTYSSVLDNNNSNILLEIGLREELLNPADSLDINTMLLNPFSGTSFLPPIKANCLSREEAYAEKIRAALTRNRLAIRDFYDIHYAIKSSLINIESTDFLKMVLSKIALIKSETIV